MNRAFYIMLAMLAAALFFLPVNAYAEEKRTTDPYGFEVKRLTEDESGLKNSFSRKRPSHLSSLKAYAVSENGTLALFYDFEAIDIFDSDNEFQYTFSPSYGHGSYLILWNGEKLYIYVNGTNYMRCIVLSGFEDAEVYDIADTEENNSLFWKLDRESVVTHETNSRSYYTEKNDLVIRNKNTGEETKIQLMNSAAYYLLPLLFIIFIAAVFAVGARIQIRQMKEKRLKKLQKESDKLSVT